MTIQIQTAFFSKNQVAYERVCKGNKTTMLGQTMTIIEQVIWEQSYYYAYGDSR